MTFALPANTRTRARLWRKAPRWIVATVVRLMTSQGRGWRDRPLSLSATCWPPHGTNMAGLGAWRPRPPWHSLCKIEAGGRNPTAIAVLIFHFPDHACLVARRVDRHACIERAHDGALARRCREHLRTDAHGPGLPAIGGRGITRQTTQFTHKLRV